MLHGLQRLVHETLQFGSVHVSDEHIVNRFWVQSTTFLFEQIPCCEEEAFAPDKQRRKMCEGRRGRGEGM
jgi:hypothetical protein